METTKAPRTSQKQDTPSRWRWVATNLIVPMVVGVASSLVASYLAFVWFRQDIRKMIQDGLDIVDVKNTTAQLQACEGYAGSGLVVLSSASQPAPEIVNPIFAALQRLKDQLDEIDSMEAFDRLSHGDKYFRPDNGLEDYLYKQPYVSMSAKAGQQGLANLKTRLGFIADRAGKVENSLQGYSRVDWSKLHSLLQTIQDTSERARSGLLEREHTMNKVLDKYPPAQ